MSACEKCWGDAYMRTYENPGRSQADHYADLLAERKHSPCTPTEQKFGRECSRGGCRCAMPPSVKRCFRCSQHGCDDDIPCEIQPASARGEGEK